MPLRQGHSFSRAQVQRIVSLLKNTDMPMPDIALAMACTRSSVVKINKENRIRIYNNHRNRWQTGVAEQRPARSGG